MAGVAVFGQAFLHEHRHRRRTSPWYPLALFGWAVIGLLASREVRKAARSLLLFELVSVALILVLMASSWSRCVGGDVPRGQGVQHRRREAAAGDRPVDASAWPPTFGFLSFAGSSRPARFGEEAHRAAAHDPALDVGRDRLRRRLLRRLHGGPDARLRHRRRRRQARSRPRPPRSASSRRRYVGRGMADALDLAAMISSFGAGMGCASVGARMLYALGRDGVLAGGWRGVSRRTARPPSRWPSCWRSTCAFLSSSRSRGPRR